MTKHLISEEEFANVQELREGDTHEGFTVIEDEYQESRRWVEVWRRVFSTPDGQLLAYYYERPATEYQEGSDTEPELSDIFPVEKQEVVVTQYVQKK